MPANEPKHEYQPVPTSPAPVANGHRSDDDGSSHLIEIPTTEDIQELVTTSVHAVSSFWDDFKAFIARGPAVDLGVGMILGTMFTALINSFMTDILTPPIGLVVGSTLDEAFIELRHGQTANVTYHTVQEAIADGAVTINVGRFASQLLTFLLVSLILYWIIKSMIETLFE
jgi:large conductance mechanosensitive channel